MRLICPPTPDRMQSIAAPSQAAAPVFGKAPDATDPDINAVADAELSRFLTSGKLRFPADDDLARRKQRRRCQPSRSPASSRIGELSVEQRFASAATSTSVEEGVIKPVKAGAITDAKDKADA